MAEATGTLVLTVDTEQSASGFENFIAGGQRVAAAFKQVKEVVDQAFDLIDASNELKRLERAVPTQAVNGFRQSLQGTVSDIDILRVANRGMQGDFRLTAQQMDLVLRTAHELHNRGFGPTVEIANKLIDALGEKSVAKLDDFGIALEATKNKTQDNAKAFVKFQEILRDPTAVDSQIQQSEQLKVKWEDSLRRMRESVVPLATILVQNLVPAINAVTKALGPAVAAAEKLGEALAGDKQLMFQGGIAGWTDLLSGKKSQNARSFYGNTLYDARRAAGGALGTSEYEELEALQSREEAVGGRIGDALRSLGGAAQDPWAFNDHGLGGGVPADTAWRFGDAVRGRPSWFRSFVERARGNATIQGSFRLGEGIGAPSNDEATLRYAGYYGRATARADAAGRDELGRTDKERWGAQDSEWSAKLQDRTGALGGAFSALSAGIAASVEAAMSGSENIAKAFGKAAAAALKSIAIEATVRAAFEGGMGLAMAAIGNPQSAVHFAAAGQFALTAAIAGTLGAGLGAISGGGPASAGARSGAGQVGGGFGGQRQQGGSQTIIVNVSGGGPGANEEFFESAVRRAVSKASGGGSRVISLE